MFRELIEKGPMARKPWGLLNAPRSFYVLKPQELAEVQPQALLLHPACRPA
jgi:hypothetical protein